MKKKSSAKWTLNPEEVTWGLHGSSSGKAGQFQRKLKVTSSIIFLKHIPTGITVEGQVLLGHYSKKEMQLKREQLKQSLFEELENKVAKRLNIKGR
jgi:protein subunit release factor A